ncbi:MAG: heme-binding protein, partial [Bacteroidota bacterium]
MNRYLLFLLGTSLWILSCSKAVPPPEVSLPAGFVIEHLYSPTAFEQGSWVSMALDDKGRIIASDQYGHLYRIVPDSIGVGSTAKVEKLNIEIGHAQGMLYAFNSLYVVVNSREGVADRNSGLYRLFDTNGDDQFDKIETIREFEGSGEHGPHTILLSPDGTSLYLIAGNHTDLPEMDHYLLPNNWGDDRLFPIYKDPRGHAYDRAAPGGWVVQLDPDGEEWTLVSAGYRNPYDMAFNSDGDLFVFDADMEWDMGMPWYRPIRLCHATHGSEFGWRTGSGKWASYYPDNLPPVVNIGQGSPTGVVGGQGLKFPTRYQKGMFLFDWSFGTAYFIELSPKGSSWTGNKEEFMSGTPLPLTDGIVGKDGAMYFLTGGRRLQSDLYRVYYQGTESTDAPSPTNFSAEQKALRQERIDWEKRLVEGENTEANAAGDLGQTYRQAFASPDRFVRYTARVAAERKEQSETLAGQLKVERDPKVRLSYALALARSSENDQYQEEINQAFTPYNFEVWPVDFQLELVRGMALSFARKGMPAEPYRTQIVEALLPHFPNEDARLNRDLCELLVYLKAPEAVARTVSQLTGKSLGQMPVEMIDLSLTERSEQYGPTIKDMLENMPPVEEISLAHHLSFATVGWTPELRRKYFEWFYDAIQMEGGVNYKGFLDQMRLAALDNVPSGERSAMAEIVGEIPPSVDLSALPQPQGPGQNWHPKVIREAYSASIKEGKIRDYSQGAKMYQAAMCEACHRMKGKGGNAGP